jgi:hypothetical protein
MKNVRIPPGGRGLMIDGVPVTATADEINSIASLTERVIRLTALVEGSPAPGSGAIWLLASGVWDDDGVWDDSALWKDAA